jgi:guanosine-3',5'-bis(diphosphate) 3'-pyrophosphohydrolase
MTTEHTAALCDQHRDPQGDQPSGLTLILKAARFSAERHRDQRRKGTDAAPYINHPLAVAEILAEAGIDDPHVLAAALLHDTVEDTETSLDEITKIFGTAVAAIVAEVTDDKALPKAERKLRQIASTPDKSYGAKLVKLADKTANMRDLATSPPNWSQERIAAYFQFASDVAAGAKGLNPALDAAFDAAVRLRVQ